MKECVDLVEEPFRLQLIVDLFRPLRVVASHKDRPE